LFFNNSTRTAKSSQLSRLQPKESLLSFGFFIASSGPSLPLEYLPTTFFLPVLLLPSPAAGFEIYDSLKKTIET